MIERQTVLQCAALLVIAFGLSAPLPATADGFVTEQHRICQELSGDAMVEYLEHSLAARQGCLTETAHGTTATQVDCLAAAPGNRTTDQALIAARANLQNRIEQRHCQWLDLQPLGWPGFCDDPNGPPYTATDHASCITQAVDRYAAQLLEVQRPLLQAILDGDQGLCRNLIVQGAPAMVSGELYGRLRCLVAQALGDIDANVGCRAESQGSLLGTGRDSTDLDVEAAHAALLDVATGDCSGIDFSTLGFGDECPEQRDTASAQIECLFSTHHDGMSRLLDVIYPQSTLCGNGTVDLGEGCDDGDRQYRSGDFCQHDCSSVECGDSDGSGGAPTVFDSLFLLRTVAGLQSCDIGICDADGSGYLTIADALLILRRATGLETSLDCPNLSTSCGNATVDPLEACDDGDDDWQPGELCDQSCQLLACGDPDGSGSTTVLDAIHILRTSVGAASCDLAVCDTNGDGTIDSIDSLMALLVTSELPADLSCGF